MPLTPSCSGQQRERFLAGLLRLGVAPAAVLAWAARHGYPPPEEWDEQRRHRCLVWLTHADHREALTQG